MKELIKNSSLTLREFSEEYKIPYNSVRQWANGERQAPAYIKSLIEEIRNLKTKGQQIKIEEIPMNQINKYGWGTINYVVQWNTGTQEYACGLTTFLDVRRLTEKLEKEHIRYRAFTTPIEWQQKIENPLTK